MALADWLRTEQVSANGRAEIGARRIYILPTRYGVMFATLLFLMLLGAVNYGNNPGHLLTFPFFRSFFPPPPLSYSAFLSSSFSSSYFFSLYNQSST